MGLIAEALAGLEELDELDAAVRKLHNKWCGKGAHVHETAGSALYEDVDWGIRTNIAEQLGQHMLDNHKKELLKLAVKEDK